jgi:hypothetical protein
VNPTYPPGDVGEVLELIDRASRDVIGDASVWREEADREGALPLPWPLAKSKGYPQFLVFLAELYFDFIIATFEERPPPLRMKEPQVVLRVVQRAVSRAEELLVDRFGGGGRLSLKRAWTSWLKELAVAAADRLPTRAERAAFLRDRGITKSAASRARDRG